MLEFGIGLAGSGFADGDEAEPGGRLEPAAGFPGEPGEAGVGGGRCGPDGGFQLVEGVGREGQDLQGTVPCGGAAGCCGFLEDGVEIGTAKSEGADAGAARVATQGPEPGPGPGGEVEWAAWLAQGGKRGAHLEGGGLHAVAQGEGGLQQAGGAGGSLGVADLRFDGSQGAPWGGRGFAVDLEEGGQLDLVAGAGTGAVRLEQADGGRLTAGLVERAADGANLAFLAGGVDGATAAVGPGAQAADDGEDAVVVALGVGQALEDHEADALAQDGSIALG